ncbi:MAG: glucose-6-phosphate isomerase [Thiohalospira sp.]
MARLSERAGWSALQAHGREWEGVHLRELFEADPDRFRRHHRTFADALLVDWSKQPVTEATLDHLLALAREADLPGAIRRLLDGERVNATEGRPALHTALRAAPGSSVRVRGEDVVPEVMATRRRMAEMAAAIHGGEWTGATGRPIRHVVNIGIGGSDLGPAMVCRALADRAQPGMQVHFLSNVDGRHLERILAAVEPAETLFIVASKSFGTQETLTNARSAREWLLGQLPEADGAEVVRRHFVAVSANTAAATEFGIDAENVLAFRDWVGGRYSLWSAIGLPIALYLGAEAFEELLAGARAMDEHFAGADLAENLPVILGLIGVWNSDILGRETHAILPYDEALGLLPAYLQQGDMESNGKRVTLEGQPVDYPTGAIVWGGTGTNGQHAFFQLLHQGTRIVPADFIAVAEPPRDHPDHHRILLSHFLAQTRALMRGKGADEARAELQEKGLDAGTIEALVPHQVLEGNRPSTTLLLRRHDPWSLGALVALYEHRIYVESVLWGTNAFDQWGVEFGKQTAGRVLPHLEAGAAPGSFDASTEGLMACALNWQRDG